MHPVRFCMRRSGRVPTMRRSNPINVKEAATKRGYSSASVRFNSLKATEANFAQKNEVCAQPPISNRRRQNDLGAPTRYIPNPKPQKLRGLRGYGTACRRPQFKNALRRACPKLAPRYRLLADGCHLRGADAHRPLLRLVHARSDQLGDLAFIEHLTLQQRLGDRCQFIG